MAPFSLPGRLEISEALLSRTDLRDLGWTRRGVDAIFRRLPTVHIEELRKPMVKVGDYRALVEESTYRGDRVRPEVS